MAPFLYRCPFTGMNAQGWFADEVPTIEGETYQEIACLGCRQIHSVNRTTKKVLGPVSEDGWGPRHPTERSRVDNH
jgi:hypothetical protein